MGFASRQRNVLEFTLSSLLRRGGRNAALVAVYAAVVFVLASAMFLTRSMRDEAAGLLDGSPDIVIQRMRAGRHDLMPLAYVREIEGIRGVSSVTPRLWGYYYDPAIGANYTLVAPEEGGSAPGAYARAFGHEGLMPPAPGLIVVGEGLAHARGLYTGDIFPFRTYQGGTLNLKVAGTLGADLDIVAADLVVMAPADYRALFGVPEGFVTDVALAVRNPREIVTVARKIVDRLPDARPVLRDEVLSTYDAVFSWRGGMMVVLFSGAALAFLIFAWDRASGLTAEERREIGILKAVGWETGDVLLMKFWEGSVVSITAYLAGVSLAYVHVYFGSAGLFAPALKGWSVLYPEFRLTPSIDAFELATLFALTVLPYTSATIVPSWRAATADPDQVMRA